MPSSRYYRFKIADKKERREKIKFWFFCLLYLTVFLTAAWALLLSPLFEIRLITSADNDYLNTETVEKIIAQIAPFGLDKNLLILPKSKLKEKLAAAFPAITDIAVKKTLLHTLAVDFKKRVPLGIWCHPTGDQLQADNCYFFDKEGAAFLKAPQSEGNLVLKIEDGSKTNAELGSKVLDTGKIDFIIDFYRKINESDNEFKIVKFQIKPEPSVDLEAVTDKNWLIYLDAGQESKTAINNLLIILKEAVKNTDKLEYIDLRIPGRVFYKLH